MKKQSSFGLLSKGRGGPKSKTGKGSTGKLRASDSSQPGIRKFLMEIKSCGKGNSHGNRQPTYIPAEDSNSLSVLFRPVLDTIVTREINSETG